MSAPGFKIEVDAQAFAAQLATVVRACSTRGSVEVLRGVMLAASIDEYECDQCGETFETDAECDLHTEANPGHDFHVCGGSCSLAATDLELSLRAHVPATVSKAGAVVLADAKQSLKLFKSLAGPLTIEQGPQGDDNHGFEILVVSFTGATYRLAAHPVDDFPVWPLVNGAGGLIDRSAFVGVLERVLKTASRDESRPVLCGVHLTFDAETTTLGATATDSYRVSHDEAAGAVSGPSLEVVYPARALGEVLRLAKAKGAQAEIAWSQSDESPEPLHLRFKLNGVEVVSRRVEGQFPNWKQLVPDRWELEASIVGAELVSAATRIATLVASQRHTPTRVSVDASTGVVTLEVQGYDGTGATETLPTPAALTFPPIDGDRSPPEMPPIGFNGPFLLDAARSCGDTVRLRLISPLRPALFLNGRDEAWHLLMPIRLAG